MPPQFPYLMIRDNLIPISSFGSAAVLGFSQATGTSLGELENVFRFVSLGSVLEGAINGALESEKHNFRVPYGSLYSGITYFGEKIEGTPKKALSVALESAKGLLFPALGFGAGYAAGYALNNF